MRARVKLRSDLRVDTDSCDDTTLIPHSYKKEMYERATTNVERARDGAASCVR